MADKKEVLRLQELAYQERVNLCKLCESYSGNIHMGGDMSMFGDEGQTLILNINHPLVKTVLENKDGELTPSICEQLYDLALLSHGSLSPERMTAFIKRSNELMMKLAK